MPELPEVETVRDGLARHVLGRTVTGVEVRRDYSVRRHTGGPLDFAGRLGGRRLDAAVRRGKFLWLLLDDGDDALMAHLGMSGQLLVRGAGEPRVEHPHLRVRLALDDGASLDFVDQRTFGHLSVPDLVPTPDGLPGGLGSPSPVVPEPVAHIARDLLDPALDHAALVAAVRRRRTGLKRALLDQTLVSGIGNIYADEGLWRAQLHYARPTETLRRAEVERALAGAGEVMTEALAQGGTSFDALYVNVNGASGYFDRSLAVYGQEGRPCPRCGTPIRRDEFMNRSSYSCPHCQPRPRRGRF
ncbi:bifunctional DNA-formamidopyrimidine glycosylase/DNA-(apurinic or apyrimidinic site) lyase [Cellulomonas sp. ICMP 17802]|uniref:bifunctional DNA-formamidopyrimidine glycosylase/DNA-(apurinic or apyrimidinic site) lyase n=1 Tax=Cellulomonas sp. ICMP 17802 TaxID=3239199 RepID=UPI00351B6168